MIEIKKKTKKKVNKNAHQQLSFLIADKSDARVRATTMSSVSFAIFYKFKLKF